MREADEAGLGSDTRATRRQQQMNELDVDVAAHMTTHRER